MTFKVDLSGWDKAIDSVRNKLIHSVETAAADVQAEAVKRAPVRKAFYSRKKASRAELASLSLKLKGGGRLSGGEIIEAAGHLGIKLDPTQLVQVRRPRDLNNASSRQGMSLRRVTPRPLFNKAGERQFGFYTTGGASKLMTSRARRDIRLDAMGGNPSLDFQQRNKGRGVIEIGSGPKGGRRYQYGGFLRKSITSEDVSSGDLIRFRVKSNAPYSRYVEFPTSRTAAQPYLLPALKGVRGKYASYFKRRLA